MASVSRPIPSVVTVTLPRQPSRRDSTGLENNSEAELANLKIQAHALPVRNLILTAHLQLGAGMGLMIARRAMYDMLDIVAEVRAETSVAEVGHWTFGGSLRKGTESIATLSG